MTGQGHTPGPWAVLVEEPWEGMAAQPGYGITGPDGQVLANAADHTCCDSGIRHEADARLIAAAPDGLAFAEAYVREVHVHHAQDSRTGRDHNPLCNMAQDFIAKARGTHE